MNIEHIAFHREHSGVTVVLPTVGVHMARNVSTGNVCYYEVALLVWHWAFTVTFYRKLKDILR